MLTSELEEIGVLREAIRLTAQKLQIDVDLKSGEDLLLEIDGHHQEICNLLRAFINAYIDWYGFNKRNDQLGKHPPLDAMDQERLKQLIGARNAARSGLLHWLSKIE